jgi:hypothetical protein
MFHPLVFDVAAASPTQSATVDEARNAESPRSGRANRTERTDHADRPARGEIHVAIGALFGGSSWRGDGLGYGGIDLGFRLFRIVTPLAGAWLGYAGVDQRLLTRISVGLDLGYTFGRVRPHIFGMFVHQHEESLAAVAQEPFGAVLGIGSGIRHRAGVNAGLGVEIRALHRGPLDLSVGPDLGFMYLTYSSGPNWYWYGGVHLSADIRLF